MAVTEGLRNTIRRGGWRRLGVFWLSVLSLLAIGAGTVQWLGPPTPPREARAVPNPAVARPAEPPAGPMVSVARTGRISPPVAGRDTPGPVADPDPALVEPLDDGSKETLPRIASDGRTPMQVYAAGFDHSSRRPRVALLLAGIGPN